MNILYTVMIVVGIFIYAKMFKYRTYDILETDTKIERLLKTFNLSITSIGICLFVLGLAFLIKNPI